MLLHSEALFVCFAFRHLVKPLGEQDPRLDGSLAGLLFTFSSSLLLQLMEMGRKGGREGWNAEHKSI